MMFNMEFSVCAVGEILIDFTPAGKNEQGQTMYIRNAGGAPANVAAAVSKFGGKSVFMGKAGNDIQGRFLKSTLDDLRVNTEGLLLTDDYFTTLAFVDIDDRGEREFAFARQYGADKFLKEEEISEDLIKRSAILHVGSVSLTEEPSRSAVKYAVETARNNDVLVSYDPNYREALWEDRREAVKHMREMLKYADLVKMSDDETEILTGERDYERAARKVCEMGASIAVVTMGRKGAFICNPGGECFVGGFESNTVDTTGAGDTFWGAFLYCFAQDGANVDMITTERTREYALFANAAASLCVRKYGGISALPSVDEIIKLLQANGLYTRK